MEQGFKRSFDSLEKIFEFIQDYFARERIDPSHLFVFCLAAEELFTNMVKYSRGGGSDITVGLLKNGDELVLTLKDSDVEDFDVTMVPTPNIEAPLQERRPGGLGLHLVRKLTDAMTYEHRDRQSHITVMKRMG